VPELAGTLSGLGLVLAAEGEAILVRGVEPEGVAHSAGLRSGDRILAVDGVAVSGSTLEQVTARLLASRPDAIRLLVRRRGGGQQELRVRRPAPQISGPPGLPAGAGASGGGSVPGRLPGPQSSGRPAVIQMAAVAVGEEAVDFTLPRLGGGQVRLSDLQGKPVFLDFWATWCAPCVAEAPALAEIYRRYGDDVQMLGVSLDYVPNAPWQFVNRFGLGYPHLITDGWEDPVIQSYGIHRTGIPFNVLIDQEGRITALDLHGEPLAQAMETLIRRD
jgi:thiol-disulfide isomerase/thioredoxin